MAKTKLVPQNANTITEGIVNSLLLEGYSASRINTQGQFARVEPAHQIFKILPRLSFLLTRFRLVLGRFRKSGSRTGYADISACVHGRFIAIEVKVGADKMRPEQEEFMREVMLAGGLYVSFKTFAEFQTWWDFYKKANNL